MSKKLNITSITNELSGGSAFFRDQKQEPPPLLDLPVETKQVIQQEQPIPAIAVRPNVSTPVRLNAKRIITRNSFETYEDQMDSLRKLSYEEKMDGKLGSMSKMVRDAIDEYIQKRSSGK